MEAMVDYYFCSVYEHGVWFCSGLFLFTRYPVFQRKWKFTMHVRSFEFCLDTCTVFVEQLLSIKLLRSAVFPRVHVLLSPYLHCLIPLAMNGTAGETRDSLDTTLHFADHLPRKHRS